MDAQSAEGSGAMVPFLCWFTAPELGDFLWANVGKYSSTMEHIYILCNIYIYMNYIYIYMSYIYELYIYIYIWLI